MNRSKTIYKRDSVGKIRYWYADVDVALSRWRSCAGIQGEPTSHVESGWTSCTGKQGRNDWQQANFEAMAELNKKLAREYRDDISKVDEKYSAWVKPMLAHKYEAWKGPCFSQPKLDGIRCIATASGLFSREGKEIHGVPHIQWALKPLFDRDNGFEVILDGELYNHDLHDDFNAIVSVVKKQTPTDKDLNLAQQLVQFHAYDLAIPGMSFGQRQAWLADKLPPNAHLIPVETEFHADEASLNLAYDRYLAGNYEGQMVRFNGAYENKRSKQLLKRKEFQDDEFTVIAVEEGNGNWAGYAKRAVLSLPDGRKFGAGIRGTQAEMRALLSAPTPATATVRFFAYTPDGIPRFPVVTAFHNADGRL